MKIRREITAQLIGTFTTQIRVHAHTQKPCEMHGEALVETNLEIIMIIKIDIMLKKNTP